MSISNVWTYRQGYDQSRDVVGYDVAATDGDIGKIDKASNDTDRSHLVVDGGLRRRLLPACRGVLRSLRLVAVRAVMVADRGPTVSADRRWRPPTCGAPVPERYEGRADSSG